MFVEVRLLLLSSLNASSFVVLVHRHLTNLSVCLSSTLITSLRDLLREKPQDNFVPLPSPDASPCRRASLIELSLPRPLLVALRWSWTFTFDPLKSF